MIATCGKCKKAAPSDPFAQGMRVPAGWIVRIDVDEFGADVTAECVECAGPSPAVIVELCGPFGVRIGAPPPDFEHDIGPSMVDGRVTG